VVEKSKLVGATENAVVENAMWSKMRKCESTGNKGGKCRSRLAVWKAEAIL